MNHFEIFGLAPSIDVDVPALETKYRELSLKHHPDRQPAASRLKAVEMTAMVNDAVKVLRDPIRRAFYLLKLKGVDLEREDGPAKQTMPMDFLEDILERREQLDIARAQKNLPKARALAAEIEQLNEEALASAQTALRSSTVEAATAALAKVRYFTRFLEEVDAIEEAAAS